MNEIKCFPFVFTKDLYNKIVQNRKTVTRRLQRRRVAEGKVYRLRKGYKPTEHLIRISKVYQQKLGNMTEEDALGLLKLHNSVSSRLELHTPVS